MSKENVLQSVITFIVAGVSAYFQIIAVPLIVLIAVMLLDYVTGMVAAYIRAELSSRKGIICILKKVRLCCFGMRRHSDRLYTVFSTSSAWHKQ